MKLEKKGLDLVNEEQFLGILACFLIQQVSAMWIGTKRKNNQQNQTPFLRIIEPTWETNKIISTDRSF